MKTSLKKFLNHHHHHSRLHHKHDRKHRMIQPLAKLDELAKASEDMQDMRDCYDSQISAAAAATNSTYEFSESLREMGICLLQKIALNDDEASGKIMMMLGKVQFELEKLLDSYRAHICQTITAPSESLLKEIHTLEEMKHKCDEKRELYEYMRTRYREKGRSKDGKDESFSLQQLQLAKDKFDEEATLFVFRLKSLKQGQCRSLLTQTARHHAAQLSFFRKGLKALEMVEPHLKLVAEQQHIDYHFSGLDDESDYGEDDDDDGEESDSASISTGFSSVEDDGELSFDYQRNDRQHSSGSAVRHTVEENLKASCEGSSMRERKTVSQSAPLFPQQKIDPMDRRRQLQQSATKKFHSYALPKPGDSRISISNVSDAPISKNKPSPQRTQHLYHSCPLQPKKHEELENLSGPIFSNPNTRLKEINNNRMPLSFTERISFPHLNLHVSPSFKKPKLQSFSVPLTSKHLSSKPSFSARVSINQLLSSPKGSPSASPPFSSSLRISELHELPKPPTNLTYNSGRPSSFIGFSAPLVLGSSEKSMTKKMSVHKVASPLHNPLLVAYSSMPLDSSMVSVGLVPSRPSESTHSTEKSEVTASPPFAPTLQANQHPT